MAVLLVATVAAAAERDLPPLHPEALPRAEAQSRGLPPMHPDSIDGSDTQSVEPPTPPEPSEQRTITVPMTPTLPEGPPAGPRDLLRRLSVDDSYFDHVHDGVPLQASEDELVLQLLDRLPQFRLEDIERWAAPTFPIEEIFPAPEPHRGEIFWLAGRLVGMRPIKLIPEVADRYGSWGYWWCTVRLAGSGVEATVLARRVPEAWQRKLAAGKPLDERVTAYGMFVKFTVDSPEQPGPLFTARRIAWHPPTPLGDLGFDVGLLDEVRNARPLTGHDREAFYAMLAAVGRAEPGQLMREARRRLETIPADQVRVDEEGDRHYSVVPLFNDPENQEGKLFFLEGTVRRAERIEVHDPDIRARFGIDHYYQLAVFTSDSRNPGGARNPVWFCVRDVPEGMPLGAQANYSERVRVAGFFLKTWAYRRGMLPSESGSGTEPNDTPKMQLSPLLIGREPIYLPPPAPMALHPMIGMIAGSLFLASLVGIWIAVWRYNRADREFKQQTLAKTYQLAEGTSLDQLGLEAADGPDFSGLAEADTGPPEEHESEDDDEDDDAERLS